MKKLNITKETFEKSKYFTGKYGKLAFVSESGNLYKTNKGKILKFAKESTFNDGIANDEEYTFLRVSVAWDISDVEDSTLPTSVFIKVPTYIYEGDGEMNLSGMIEDYFGYPIDDISPSVADERDKKRVKDWLLWTDDEGLVEDDGVGMRYSEGTRMELVPTNGRKSFGHKAYVEDDGDGFTLYSYNTPVARIERLESGHGQEFSLLSDYLSNTTLTHIHSFLQSYGLKDIPTRELLEMSVGDSVPMMAAESKKGLVKEAGRKVIPAENGCSIHDMGDCFIVTNKNGLNIGQCRTMIEAEDIAENADEYTKRKLGLESKKLVNEGAGAGYTVRIKDLKFGSIMDKKLIKGKESYDDYYECQVEILPGEYEIEAEDYYNDFFWQEHEFGERAFAKIDGGVATIEYSTNSYDEDEAEDELRHEVARRTMDIAFGYGWGWVHADLPKDKPIESDHVDVEGTEFYGSIDKIELNAPDLADAVNGGFQSIYDRDEEEEEDDYEDELVSEVSGWKLEDEDLTLVNSESDGDKLYIVKLWWGSGYMTDNYNAYANSAEEALNYTVAYIEKHDPKLLETTDQYANDLMDEIEQDHISATEMGYDDDFYPEDTPEFQEAYTWVDATMEGAKKGHYVHSENLTIAEYPKEHNYPMSKDIGRMNESYEHEWRVFDYGEDFPYTERYTVLDPDGYQFFISHNGGVGAFTEDPLEGTSEEICDELEVEIEDKMWKPVELSKREMLDNITVMKGLRRIKEKYDYDDQD